jgi:hypothetical protein
MVANLTSSDDLKALFKHAQDNGMFHAPARQIIITTTNTYTGYAIPAINVTSSSTVVAALEAARDAKAPIVRIHSPV